MHLYGKDTENSVSRNVLMINGLNLQCMIKVENPFSYNQTFCLPELPAFLPLGYIQV